MNRGQRALEALVYGTIIAALFIVGVQLWTSDLGIDTRPSGKRLVVTAVDPGGAAERAGLAPGDEIVDLPGLSVFFSGNTERELFESHRRLGRAMADGHVPVRIVRGGSEIALDVVPLPAPHLRAALRQLRRFGTDLPTSFAFLGVAALLVRARGRSPEDEHARRTMAASFALLGPAWTVEWPAPGWPAWLYPVASFFDAWSGCAGVLLLAMFAWSYPHRARVVDSSVVRWVLVIAGLPCAAFSSLNTLLFWEAPRAVHGNALMVLFDSALAVAILFGLVWQRARAKTVVARRQSNVMLASVAVGFFVPILFLLVPKHVFGRSEWIMDEVLFPFPMLVPVGFAAVVARYRLFSLDGIALRVAPYVISVVTSLLACVVFTVGLQAAFDWRTGSPSDAARWLGVLVALVLAEPLRRFIRRTVDRMFGRDRDAFLRQCSELAARLSGSSDARAIEAAVESALDARAARLLDLDETLSKDSADAVRADLARAATRRVLDLADPLALDRLHSAGLELLVLVPSSDPSAPARHVLGLTLPRPAERIGTSESEALALVGRVIGASLAQAAARRALDGEKRRARDERQHIAMELHDSLGATLAAASLMTRNLRARSTNADERTLDALDTALREGLGDLRASLWSLDPGQASWGDLVGRVQRHARDMCEAANVVLAFETTGEPPAALSAAARLAILRVIQQALTNALEHGRPREVDVRMSVGPVTLEIVVDDDGVGIAPDAPRGRGLGNMARRVEAFGGAFRIERRDPAGTRVAIGLPISRLSMNVEIHEHEQRSA